MADDFIELGLEGADKLIDKHFHKVPDKLVQSETYKPHIHHHHHGSRRDSKDSSSQSRSRDNRRRGSRESEEYDDRRYDPDDRTARRRRSSGIPLTEKNMAASNNGRPADNADSGPYNQDGPFITPPFTTMPNQTPQGPGYAPSQYSHVQTTRDDGYSVRPANMRRRSSSYHGPRRSGAGFYSSDSDDEASDARDSRRYRDHQVLATRNRSPTRSHYSSQTKDHGSKSHNQSDFTDNIKENFTQSKEGLAGGALGALVGGWATHKALESRHGKKGGNDAVWTVLGAAVGGLAVNAVVDKLEDKKKAEKDRRGRDSEKGYHSGGGRARSERGGINARADWDDDYDDRRSGYYR